MKKALCIIATLTFLLSLYACSRGYNITSDQEIAGNSTENVSLLNNDNSIQYYTGKYSKVLLGDGYIGDVYIKDEVVEKGKDYTIKEKIGEKKIFKILNLDVEAAYIYSTKEINRKTPFTIYLSNNNKQCVITDSNSNDVIGFVLHDFPNGYNKKTELVDITTAQDICIDFLKNDFELKDYVFTNIDKLDGLSDIEYQFILKKYINGVAVHYLRVNLDMFGNIYKFRMSSTDQADNITIPDLLDDDYIAVAKERVDEACKNQVNIKETRDYAIDYKQLAYIEEKQSNAIEFVVTYTIVYYNGPKYNTRSTLFYLFP